jgi:integrase
VVFTTPRGTPIDPRNANRQFGEFLRRNELPPIRVHDFRHTAASLLLAQGLTLEDSSAI